MRKIGFIRDKSIEKTISDILESKAKSRIYMYLLKKGAAKTEQIIKGTKLHPSTVRETLSLMFNEKLIYREKIRIDSIGKNPYLYYPISPIKLLKQYASVIEYRLNKLAILVESSAQNEQQKPIKITIINEESNKI